jgi:hypothetical protein
MNSLGREEAAREFLNEAEFFKDIDASLDIFCEESEQEVGRNHQLPTFESFNCKLDDQLELAWEVEEEIGPQVTHIESFGTRPPSPMPTKNPQKDTIATLNISSIKTKASIPPRTAFPGRPPTYLGKQMLSNELLSLDFLSTFFGCYWRNRNNNICGFPYVVKMNQQMDYQSFLYQQKQVGVKDIEETQASVKIAFTVKRHYDSAKLCLVARMCSLNLLPIDDHLLIGEIVSRLKMLDPSSPTPVIALSEGHFGNYATVETVKGGKKIDQHKSNSSCTNNPAITDNSLSTYIAHLSPRSWKYVTEGSNVQKKEKWTYKPITNIIDARNLSENRHVLQVRLYNQINDTNGGTYQCLGVIRSPAFLLGSKRSLCRRMRNTTTLEKKRELSACSSAPSDGGAIGLGRKNKQKNKKRCLQMITPGTAAQQKQQDTFLPEDKLVLPSETGLKKKKKLATMTFSSSTSTGSKTVEKEEEKETEVEDAVTAVEVIDKEAEVVVKEVVKQVVKEEVKEEMEKEEGREVGKDEANIKLSKNKILEQEKSSKSGSDNSVYLVYALQDEGKEGQKISNSSTGSIILHQSIPEKIKCCTNNDNKLFNPKPALQNSRLVSMFTKEKVEEKFRLLNANVPSSFRSRIHDFFGITIIVLLTTVALLISGSTLPIAEICGNSNQSVCKDAGSTNCVRFWCCPGDPYHAYQSEKKIDKYDARASGCREINHNMSISPVMKEVYDSMNCHKTSFQFNSYCQTLQGTSQTPDLTCKTQQRTYGCNCEFHYGGYCKKSLRITGKNVLLLDAVYWPFLLALFLLFFVVFIFPYIWWEIYTKYKRKKRYARTHRLLIDWKSRIEIHYNPPISTCCYKRLFFWIQNIQKRDKDGELYFIFKRSIAEDQSS